MCFLQVLLSVCPPVYHFVRTWSVDERFERLVVLTLVPVEGLNMSSLPYTLIYLSLNIPPCSLTDPISQVIQSLAHHRALENLTDPISQIRSWWPRPVKFKEITQPNQNPSPLTVHGCQFLLLSTNSDDSG